MQTRDGAQKRVKGQVKALFTPPNPAIVNPVGDVKVGDVFVETRGWVGLPPDPSDESYVDAYQVTRLNAKSVAVRRIALKAVPGRFNDGLVVPAPGRFIKSTRIPENKAGEIVRRVLCDDLFGTRLKMVKENYEDPRHPIDESYAYLWDGHRVYAR